MHLRDPCGIGPAGTRILGSMPWDIVTSRRMCNHLMGLLSTVPSGVGVQNHPGLRSCHDQASARRHSSNPDITGPATDLGTYNVMKVLRRKVALDIHESNKTS